MKCPDLRKKIKKKLTIMFVPHYTNRSLKISIPVVFIYFIILCWIGITTYSFFITSRHINYVATKWENKALKEKIAFFAQEVVKSKDLVLQVKKIDQQLRNLVALNSKKVINRYPFYTSYLTNHLNLGKGGPSKNDQKIVDKLFQKS